MNTLSSSPLPIGEARGRLGEQVTVRGWIGRPRTAPDSFRFLLSDRSGELDSLWEPAEDLAGCPAEAGSTVRASGTVAGSARSPHLHVETLEVLAQANGTPSAEANGDKPTPSRRHLELRSPERFLIFAVQSTLETAMREYALARGFIELHTPKISGGGSESGATVFRVPYFDQEAFLVQSAQFYMQMAMAAGFERVFEIGPVFRSEPGTTPIHATEFTIAHFEMSWIDSHRDLMDFEEGLLRHALAAVAEAHGEAIESSFDMPVEIPSTPIPRFPVGILKELTGDESADGRERLLGEAERALSKRAHREHGHSLVFITDYPASARPFYTMQELSSGDGEGLSRSFDMLWNGIEITSGGQREHRFDRLDEQIGQAGLEAETIDAYLRPHFLEMFRDGCPPHGGFGIGINRLLMALLGQRSIRDTSFVFRGPKQHMP